MARQPSLDSRVKLTSAGRDEDEMIRRSGGCHRAQTASDRARDFRCESLSRHCDAVRVRILGRVSTRNGVFDYLGPITAHTTGQGAEPCA